MAYIDLKNEKRINNNGEWDKVTTHPNNEPIFRQNGYQLDFNASNSDYVEITKQIDVINGTSIILDVEIKTEGQTARLISSLAGDSSTYIQTFTNNSLRIYINGNFETVFTGLVTNGRHEIIFRRESDINYISFDGNEVALAITDIWSITNCHIARRTTSYYNMGMYELSITGETFEPININNKAQIIGSSGTIAQVYSSAADPINYTLSTVFQKSSFALVGNGTTEKIVGHLGTEIILTSTPLVGGFTLDSVIYTLYEGLGNETTSTTGEKATIQGFTGTGLNFGGWLKGNNIDGWNPYILE